MLKGVNKSVIEINCTDSGYFERAILFVNPEQSHISQKRLQAEAEKYIDMIGDGFDTDFTPKQKGKSKKGLIAASVAAATLTVILILVFNIL